MDSIFHALSFSYTLTDRFPSLSQWEWPISSTSTNLLQKHWSIKSIDLETLISTTNPLPLTHKRHLRWRYRSETYLLVCLCGCICVSLCWIVLLGVLLYNKGKRRWGRRKEVEFVSEEEDREKKEPNWEINKIKRCKVTVTIHMHVTVASLDIYKVLHGLM